MSNDTANELVVRHGDTLVVVYPNHLTNEQAARVKAEIEARLPNVPNVVISGAQALVIRHA